MAFFTCVLFTHPHEENEKSRRTGRKINTLRKQVIISPIPDWSVPARSNDHTESKHALQPWQANPSFEYYGCLSDSLSSTSLTFLANPSMVKGFWM
jgi:hypothetical protein